MADGPNNPFGNDNVAALDLIGGVSSVEVIGVALTGSGIIGSGNLTLRDSVVVGGQADNTLIVPEIGLRAQNGALNISGDLVMIGSTVKNTTSSYGGYFEAPVPQINVNGNAILVNSSVINNPTRNDAYGSTIYTSGDLTLFQTTVAGNGLYDDTEAGYLSPVRALGDLNIVSSVIAGNVRSRASTLDKIYQVAFAGAGTVSIANSIIIGGTDATPRFGLPPGQIVETGANILLDANGVSTAGTPNVSARSIFENTKLELFRTLASGTIDENGVPVFTFTEQYIQIPIPSSIDGRPETTALSPIANSPAINAAIGTLPSEADLGVDIDRDGVLSTDPINTDANGNLRIVGGAMDLGPVEVQNIKPARLKIIGDEADNTLTDAVGNDNFFGRGGSDTFVLIADGLADNIKDFELGSDRIDLSAWNVTSYDALSFREHPTGKLILTYGDEVLSIRATDGPLAEADITADSFIFAEAQSAPPVRLVQGTDAGEKLYGTALDETLIDGAGKDNLFGRSGADTFVLVADGVVDNIKDFEIGVDQIDLSAWGVTRFADLDFGLRNERKVIIRFEDEVLTVLSPDGPLAKDSLIETNFILG